MTHREKYWLVKQAGLKDTILKKLFGAATKAPGKAVPRSFKLFPSRAALPTGPNAGHKMLGAGNVLKLPWWAGGRLTSTLVNDLRSLLTGKGLFHSTGRGWRFNPFTWLNPARYPSVGTGAQAVMKPVHYAGARMGSHTPAGRLGILGAAGYLGHDLYANAPRMAADSIVDAAGLGPEALELARENLTESFENNRWGITKQMTLPFIDPRNYIDSDPDSSWLSPGDWFKPNTERNAEMEQAKALWNVALSSAIGSGKSVTPSARQTALTYLSGLPGTIKKGVGYSLANLATHGPGLKSQGDLLRSLGQSGLDYVGELAKEDLQTPIAKAIREAGVGWLTSDPQEWFSSDAEE